MATEYKLSYTATEIDEKLGMVDSMVKSVNGVMPDENGNVEITVSETGTNIELDTTLTVEGKAADAKAVGDALANIGNGVVVASVEPAEDDIPKVFFGAALPQSKTDTIMPFRYISKTLDISGYCETKAQGNSTMSFPKKNQTVKMYKDAACTEKLKVDFKGWGKQNKHCYKANWIDMTHARNVVSARIWGDIVKTRSNYAELPEELRTSPNQGAVDGFPIKVYADGVYQGRYTLNIPKDKWTFNMDDALEEHCVLCGEGYNSGCFREVSMSQWTDEIHDTCPASIQTRWLEIIEFVKNSTDDDFKANLGNYFDIPSVIDYHLYGLASCGFDAYGKNQLYVTYDGQKWFASMYDMDGTWGQYYTGAMLDADYARTSYEDYLSTGGNLLYIRLEGLFWEELQSRWAELKTGALSIENIINRFERFTDIAPAELVAEDYAPTTAGGAFTGIPSTDISNIQQIRAFALARQKWTDWYVAALTPAEQIPCAAIALSANELTFTEVGTQTLTATITPENTTDPITWSSSDSNIARVSSTGVVTAVANGEAIITVCCGVQSAMCTVHVSGISTGGSGGIDYTWDALDGVTFTNGGEFNARTGEFVESNRCFYTEKFELQACPYIFNSSDVNACNLYIWDDNDNYIGVLYLRRQQSFTTKAGYKYAISLYSSNWNEYTVLTGSTLLPSEPSGELTTVSIDLSALTWESDNNVAVADISSYDLVVGNIGTANYFVGIGDMGGVSTKIEPIFSLYSNTLLYAYSMTAEEATAYFAENPTTLVING